MTGKRFVRGSGCAAGDPQGFDLVESIAVPVGGQCWGAAGTKLVSAIQSKRSNVGPMRELRLLGEIRWCRLVISRGSAEDIGDRLGIRTVVLPLCQNNISDLLSYGDAVRLPAVGELPQRQLKLGVERCLEVRIQVYQDFVRGCRRRLLGTKRR